MNIQILFLNALLALLGFLTVYISTLSIILFAHAIFREIS